MSALDISREPITVMNVAEIGAVSIALIRSLNDTGTRLLRNAIQISTEQ
jgi:hypothetical protein